MAHVGSIVIANAELGERHCDVEVCDGRISRIGSALTGADLRVDAAGGALLPGLHDHHAHLLAHAAASVSVDVARGLDALRNAEPVDGWLRGVGLDVEVDRADLDRVRADVPLRVQHRSGSLWVLNSAAIALTGATDAVVAGIERDGAGRPTGRLWRSDEWLSGQVPRGEPDLIALGAELAALGITSVTDASPHLSAVSQALLEHLAQRVTLLTAEPDRLPAGPRKIVVGDHDLPHIDDIVADIQQARTAGRAVAVHAVTRAALLLVLAAIDEIGSIRGDRIEHAAVAHPEAVAGIRRHGLVVVTQPSLVASRGDAYLDRCDTDDIPYLWPFRSLLEAGVPTVASSDAPYGDIDPWATVRAAGDRRTPSGRILGADERVPADVALGGYLTAPTDPAGPPRRVAVGAPADLALLDVPLAVALTDPRSEHVRATLIGGRLVHGPH